MKSSFAELVTQYPSGAASPERAGRQGLRRRARPHRRGQRRRRADRRPGEALARHDGHANAVLQRVSRALRARPDRGLSRPATGFAYTAQELEAAMADADILVLVNPDNPSGHFLAEAETKGLVDSLLAAGKRVIVDESFADFAEPGLSFTLLDDAYLSARPGLVVIKSISKSYGVPGFRLGVLATGTPRSSTAIRKDVPVWNINSLGEFFLQIVDKYKADYRDGLRPACRGAAAVRRQPRRRPAGSRSIRRRPTTCCAASSTGRVPRPGRETPLGARHPDQGPGRQGRLPGRAVHTAGRPGPRGQRAARRGARNEEIGERPGRKGCFPARVFRIDGLLFNSTV